MSPVEEAIAFVRERVLDPALADEGLDKQVRSRVTNSLRWINRFDRVGDLLVYLQRFKGTVSSDTYAALKARSLLTFEDVLAPFEQRFGIWANDRTTPESFVIGHQYSSFQILIFVGAYDTRAGGMFLLGEPSAPQAVVIKATLQGGRYPNAWIEPHKRLKYYLKSRNGVFGEHFQENDAILREQGLPVLSFVRGSEDEPFTFEGVLGFEAIHREDDGSKWFELMRGARSVAIQPVTDASFLEQRLEEAIAAAEGLSTDDLDQRLASSPRTPKKTVVQTTAFERSALVIVAVLRRAKGKCEGCAKQAPFKRRRDGSPYLEVHHKIRLADGGEDTVENAIALCPNCHRAAHYA